MKILFALIIVFGSASADWLSNFEAAKDKASKEDKMILLNFSGSDWCAPCIKLKHAVFESDTFKKFANEKLVLLQADFPRLKKNQLEKDQIKHNEMLAEKYNPEGKFPFTLLLDAKGNIAREWDGYSNQSPEEFVLQLQSSLSK